MIRLAVSGCGQIANAHLKAIATIDGVELTYTQDVEEDRARAAADTFGSPKWTTDYAEVLSSPDVDAVILCLPHHLHLAFSVQAAEAGKHVLVEKPMALTEAEGQQMVDAAESAGVHLVVGQSTRCKDGYWKAKSLIDAGAIGDHIRHVVHQRLFFIEELSTDWRRVEGECGGLYLPLFGSHDVDALLWLVSDVPVEVSALLRSYSHASSSESDGLLCRTFADGKIASIQFSTCSHQWRDEMVLVGSEGTLAIGRRNVRLNGEEVEIGDDESEEEFTRQTRLFVEALHGEREVLASGRDVAKKTLRTLDLARSSAEVGRPVKF